jgi:hypothetical protein
MIYITCSQTIFQVAENIFIVLDLITLYTKYEEKEKSGKKS